MPFASSNILNFHYDTLKRKMTVYFSNNSKYEVEGVPYDKYADFLEAKSKGEFYNNKIKSIYKHTKIY